MIRNLGFLSAAYGVIWGALMVFLVVLYLKMMKLSQKLEKLERTFKKNEEENRTSV